MTQSLEPKQFSLWTLTTSLTWLMGITGLVITIIYLPKTQVSGKLLIAIIICALLIIITLVHVIVHLHFGAKRRAALPALLTVERWGDSGRLILVLRPSVLFSHESSVAIFHNENSVEHLLGVGYVETIQENGLIQVRIIHFVEPEGSQFWTRLIAKNRDVLPQILVKPYVPRQYLALP